MGKKLSLEEFIEKAKKVHYNKYDYDNVIYKNSKIKIKINCYKHGIFNQIPSDHLQGSECPQCANSNRISKLKHPIDKFINNANNIHDNLYDYGKVKYINNHTKIIIVCKSHGEFKQTPNSHLTGKGCPKCKNKNKIKSLEEFIRDAKKIHGNLYNYNNVDYINSKIKIIIVCKSHGEFKQTPNSHLNGNGCPICGWINIQLHGKTKTTKCTLYFIEVGYIHNRKCLKFGTTTSNINKRFKSSIENGYKIREIQNIQGDYIDMLNLEWELLQQVNPFKCEWIPKCFSGHTECFTLTEKEGLDIWNKLVI